MVDQAQNSKCLISMKLIFIVALLVGLCSATSPPKPVTVTPLHCNESLSETEVAIDLINQERDEGFVLKPLRIEAVFVQESRKIRGGFIYYLDLDVLETDCSVLSGKSWRDCTNDIPLHETVFGHCKAIILIAKPWRILKLLNYNCTLSTVPAREIVRMCPDCPSPIRDITPFIKAKADHLAEQHNKDSNHTNHFKVDEIERVRMQYVFGPSYFIQFTIKETECVKTEANVNLADCKFLKDQEADVGFCKGSTYNTPDRTQAFQVTCEIYEPRDDDGKHGRRHESCKHDSDSPKNAPGADAVEQEGAGEAGQEGDAPGKREHHKHGHFPHRRGHKHHHCRHHDHPPHHHHHHHHHHGSQNDSHPHHDDHHNHHHHNHTSPNDGSSSEENSDNKAPKPHEKRSKGSVQFHDLTDDQEKVPVPTIVRLPPPSEDPEKYGKFGKYGKHVPLDNIAFPSEHSTLNTCPGEPLVDVHDKIRNHIF